MKIRAWLYNKFLPAWCRDDLILRNQKLKEKVAALQRDNERLQAYIDGMEYAIRRRAVIKEGRQ